MKVDGSLGSLVQGVSQQAPTERPLGQHTAQVNMLADPVRGLSRRHGSEWQNEVALAIDLANAAANRSDITGWRSFNYTNNSRDLVVLYRAKTRVAGSDLPPAIVYDKTNKQFLTLVRNSTDTVLDSLASGGVSAITAVGKYVFMAGNTITAAGTSTDVYGSSTNQQKTVLWVRGGAYSRTYKATVTKADNTQVSFEYKTPTSSYPGALSTGNIPAWIPDSAGSSTTTAPTLTATSVTLTITGTAGQSQSITGTSPANFYLTQTVAGIASNYINGLDYSISGGVITLLRDVGTGVDPLVLTYQYQSGGTSTVTVYATISDSDALFAVQNGAYATANLIYQDWNPTSLVVKNESQTMTNVYPALPTTPNQYAWAGDNAPVVFLGALASNLKLTSTYTHQKVLNNPHYTKQITDATTKYNNAVTQWIGTSSAAIQPEAIAASLRDAATLAGLTGVSVVGSTVVFTGIKDIAATDGGDGTLLKGLANTVPSVSDLTDAHFVGKIVKVSPTGGEAFYMKANAKNPSITSGVTESLWVECAAVDRTINSALVYGVASGSSFYIASSATLLNAILPGDHPTYQPATVGDDDSSPMPYFVGKKISYLGVFQDRLLIGSGAVLRFSKVGNYLTFFRSSVLTIPADDPFEVLSQGSEDDNLRFSVLYDRDLILFGKRQYAISGRSAISPTSANMQVMSSHEGANDAAPVAAGGLIFYAKQGQAATSVHQIEPGRNPESPESFGASTQIDDYMTGDPMELTAVSKPSTLLVRTSGAPNTLFVFQYLDTNQERKQSCWNRWDYATGLGPIIGTSTVREGVLLFTLRTAKGMDEVTRQYVVADLQSLDGQLSTRPYLDSNRLYADVVASPGSLNVDWSAAQAAYGSSTSLRFLGVDALADVPDMQTELGEEDGIYAGFPFLAYWTPTNPLARDSSGRAVNAGRLTVTSVLVSFRNSSGFRSVVTAFRADSEFAFNGRIVDDVDNRVGEVPVSTGRQSIPIGRESREYEQTIHALTWLPLNITSVDWTGQLFHRPQRIG